MRGVLLGRAADARRADRVQLLEAAVDAVHAAHARRVPGDALGATPEPERRSSSSTARPPDVAVVAGQLVDVHRDEAVGRLAVDPAPEPLGVLERLVAVVEPDADRLAEHRRDVAEPLAEVPPRGVHAERQRQAGLLLPPDAEVEHLVQARRRRR